MARELVHVAVGDEDGDWSLWRVESFLDGTRTVFVVSGTLSECINNAPEHSRVVTCPYAD